MSDQEIIAFATTKLPPADEYQKERIHIVFPNTDYVVSVLQTMLTTDKPVKGYHEVAFKKGLAADKSQQWDLVGIVK